MPRWLSPFAVRALLWVPVVASTRTLAVTSASQLRAALDTAQAGGEIVLANGIYPGTFTIGKSSGTEGKPITMWAANRHRSIIKGSGNLADTKQFELTVNFACWVIDGL